MTHPQSDNCRFCLENKLLIDEPLLELERFYLLGSIDPVLPHQVIIVPFRHVETPFEMNADEWRDLGGALTAAKTLLEPAGPSGFNIGWNVGAVAGQSVFHAHLHVIARFEGEAASGIGIHGLFR